MSIEQNTYLVRVDKYGQWNDSEYREVTTEELDTLISKFGDNALSICSRGNEGAMVMWAYFKNIICRGCYEDMINAYRLMSHDSKSLVEREHELRYAYERYRELWQIRYYGSVEKYYLKKAEEAKHTFENCSKCEHQISTISV